MAQVAEMVERVLELRGGVFRRAFGEAAWEGGASRSAGVAREPPPLRAASPPAERAERRDLECCESLSEGERGWLLVVVSDESPDLLKRDLGADVGG